MYKNIHNIFIKINCTIQTLSSFPFTFLLIHSEFACLTYIHTYFFTHIHTYKYTHKYTCKCISLLINLISTLHPLLVIQYPQRFSKGNILHSLSISSTSKCKFKMKKQY